MTSKQKQLETSHRTCTACGGRFTTWQGDDETMCNPCIIASFDDPAAGPVSSEGITGLYWDNLGNGGAEVSA